VRHNLGSILLVIGALLTVAGLWLAIRNMPGQEVIKPGLVCMSFGFMFRMLGPAPTRHRQDREP
jgi:hypothetical protein